MSANCFECSEGAMISKSGTFRFDPPPNIPGGTIVIPDATWEECSKCGECIIPPSLWKRLEEVRYERLGLLKPDEIKAVRQRAGLTQSEISEKLGIGEKTYTRWEAGRSIQNKSNDTLIRLFDMNHELFDKLELQRDPERRKVIGEYIDSLAALKGTGHAGLAAHDAELNVTDVEKLRQCLEQIIATQKDT